MSKSKQNNHQDNKTESTPAKISSKGTEKPATKSSVPTDLIELGRVSEATTASLTANMDDFTKTSIESISALKGMHTNGRDPKLDEKIVDSIMQIESDARMMATDQAERITEKNNTDIQLILLGLWIFAAIVCNGDSMNGFGSGKINLSQITNDVKNLLSSKFIDK